MSISEFCSRHVVCAERGTTINEAARLMRQHHVGDVIIVDCVGVRRIPVGIVTDRDIVVEIVAAGLDARALKVDDLVDGPLVTVAETASYAETVRLMSNKGVRRIPVLNAAGDLVGIITLDDMLRQLAGPLAQLGELTNRGRQHETRTRA